MNKIFKKVTLFVAMIMAVCAVSVITSTEAKAATTINVKQTAQTTTSATITWDAVPGTYAYVVRAAANGNAIATTQTNSYTLSASQAGTTGKIMITAYNSYGSLIGSSTSFWVVTAPEIKDVTLYKWEVGTTAPMFTFDGTSNYSEPTGVEVEVKNAKKKTIKVLDVAYSKYYSIVNIGSGIKNSSFIMRARPYYSVNGTKVYGAWTADKGYVAQPKVTGKSKKNYYYRTRSITIKWPKIKGAQSYSIYRSTSKDGKYKKVGSTKSTSFSQGVNYSTTYYYYVKADKVKVGGKQMSTTLGKVYYIAVSY